MAMKPRPARNISSNETSEQNSYVANDIGASFPESCADVKHFSDEIQHRSRKAMRNKLQWRGAERKGLVGRVLAADKWSIFCEDLH